jgi:peptide-methionine (S)-S-oxide reductase
MSRRNILLRLGVMSGMLGGVRALFSALPAEAARAYEVTHTDAEWQTLLKPDQYRVLRQAGTETPYTSPLDKEKRAGVFSCAGCAQPLFSSATKFESGTGWPSFWQPMDKAVVEESDTTLFMKRTEVLCQRCGGHLGHVFDDGPKPTGLRYCMNGIAMNFMATHNPLTLLAGAALALSAWAYLGGGIGVSSAAESAVRLPAPALDLRNTPSTMQAVRQTAVFAGGCFWGVQAVFQHTQGVLNAVSGYAGGDRATATYDLTSSGRTGHAESVQITYDPRQVSYGKLLQIYFSVAHDPTTLNRQGPDAGTQYRSAIFYADAGQKQVAERYIAQLDAANIFPGKIVTQLTPLTAFYPAESYHQDYATLHPSQPYIARFDLPKIANLKSMMPELYRDKPVLVSSQGGV